MTETKNDQRGLGEISIERSKLSPEQRKKDYFLLVQTKKNILRNKRSQSLIEQDALFQKSCEVAKVKPTNRQASKWARKFGAAWEARNQAKEQMAA